jgi:hypothetical protein
MQKYVVLSLELHLFFSRIMKEHSLFLEAGFVQKDEDFIREANRYRDLFEKLLFDVVQMSSGIVRPDILNSGEIVTEYTYSTERHTEKLTGIPIDSNITLLEEKLRSARYLQITDDMGMKVRRINREALRLLDGLISLKEEILRRVLNCNMFTVNYPLLIKHIIREAKLYQSYVVALENGRDIEYDNMRDVELFWNQIMMEHSLFIRGLLDPSEYELVKTSNEFANDFEQLLEEARNMTDETIQSITNETIIKTKQLRDFKAAGAKGIDSCKIQSIIVPLLADHVLREANHYLRLLHTS